MAAGSTSTGSHAIASAARSALRRSRQQQSGIIQNFQSLSTTSSSTSTTSTSAIHTPPTTCGVCSSRHPFSTSSSQLDATSSPASSSSYSALTTATSAASLPPKSTTSPPQRRSALIRPVRIVPPRQATSISKTAKKAPKTHQPPVRPSVDERTAQVSKLYALQAVPPPTALAALANRISSTLLGSDSKLLTDSDKEEWLKKIEICCTCPSFWSVVREEERQEEIRRFQEQQQSALSGAEESLLLPEQQKKYTNYLDGQKLHNEALATLGNHLLGVFAIEWLEARYPRLPTGALKAALTLYVGPRTCADIASRQWGIHSGQAASQAFLGITASHVPGQPLRGVNEGNRAGMGLLRWGKPSDDDLRNLVQRGGSSASVKSREEGDHRTPLPLEEALASAARAVVGLVFQEHGFVAARQFVHANFLSRQADIGSLLKFSNPKYTLTSTIARQSMASPTTRILAETGRLSIAPIFVLGVYSGSIKLGEGYGSSLAMAEYRACEDALRRIYLSSQERFINIFAASPSSASSSFAIPHAHAGSEEAIRGYPSDTLVHPGSKVEQRPLLEDETLYQSSGRSSVVSRV